MSALNPLPNITAMNVLLVDDCVLYCDGLSLLLESAYPQILVNKCYSGEDAIAELRAKKYSLVICDLQLNSEKLDLLQGFHVAHFIVDSEIESKILILTNITGKASLIALQQLGVNGLLFKSVNKELLKECIDTLLHGQDYIQKEIRSILKSVSNQNQPGSVRISNDEFQVLESLKLGLTAKEISANRMIPERTVRYIRDRLLLKTQTKNCAELVRFSMINSLVVEQ